MTYYKKKKQPGTRRHVPNLSSTCRNAFVPAVAGLPESEGFSGQESCFLDLLIFSWHWAAVATVAVHSQ